MKRCKHDNVDIVEYITGSICSSIIGGELSTGPNGGAQWDGVLWISCSDCGLQRTYKEVNAPRWVINHLETIYNDGKYVKYDNFEDGRNDLDFDRITR